MKKQGGDAEGERVQRSHHGFGVQRAAYVEPWTNEWLQHMRDLHVCKHARLTNEATGIAFSPVGSRGKGFPDTLNRSQ